jgi:hypothetical protein
MTQNALNSCLIYLEWMFSLPTSGGLHADRGSRVGARLAGLLSLDHHVEAGLFGVARGEILVSGVDAGRVVGANLLRGREAESVAGSSNDR